MDHTIGNRDKGRSKPPSLLACISCRRSHLKCDGQKPLCRRCAEKGCECLWIESRRGYRDYRKQGTPPRERPCREQQLQHPQERQHDTTIDSGLFVFSSSQGVGSDADSFVLEGDFATIPPYTYDQLFGGQFTSAGELPTTYNDGTLPFTAFQMDLPSIFDPTSSPGGSTSSSAASTRNDMLIPGRDRSGNSQHDSNKDPTDLIDIFYKYFYAAHPFVIPQNLATQRPDLLPKPLRATMRFVAAHYAPNYNMAALQKRAQQILSDQHPNDVFKLQGLMLYACACFARYEQSAGAVALDKAIRLALEIGINKHTFALSNAPSNPILQESFRRTWWSLFLIDGLVTAIGGQTTIFRLQATFSDVPLPCDDKDYNNLYLISSPRSLRQFRNRTFSEDLFPYSSHAYAIEALYIMGAIFSVGAPAGRITSALDHRVEAIDASISNFLFSLPPNKREVIPNPHTNLLDEPLLLAHMIINWASIQLHRPRSSLTFMRNNHHHHHENHSYSQQHDDFSSMPSCTPPGAPSPSTPTSQSYASHTSKALVAANNIVQLGSLPRSLAHCTPTMMCALTAAATVHLPAYALATSTAAAKGDILHHQDLGATTAAQDEAAATVIRERLQLGISALGRFAEIWPRAKVAKGQVAGFAREVLGTAAAAAADGSGKTTWGELWGGAKEPREIEAAAGRMSSPPTLEFAAAAGGLSLAAAGNTSNSSVAGSTSGLVLDADADANAFADGAAETTDWMAVPMTSRELAESRLGSRHKQQCGQQQQQWRVVNDVMS